MINLYQVHIYFQEESPFWNIFIFICLKNQSWHKNTSALGGLESRDSRSKRTPLHTESFLRLAGLPHKLLAKEPKGSLWFISRTHLKFPCLMNLNFNRKILNPPISFKGLHRHQGTLRWCCLSLGLGLCLLGNLWRIDLSTDICGLFRIPNFFNDFLKVIAQKLQLIPNVSDDFVSFVSHISKHQAASC